jgi:hypothetical protein
LRHSFNYGQDHLGIDRLGLGTGGVLLVGTGFGFFFSLVRVLGVLGILGGGRCGFRRLVVGRSRGWNG